MAMKENTFMHRVAELIVKLRWVFIILFVAAIVFSAFSVQWIQVENDIKAYLPDSSEAKQGLQIMNREFVTYGTADIMVQNVNREEAMEIYDALVAHDGVVLVNFDLTEAHYKDASALYSVTFNGPAESDECNAAMESVRPLFAGHKYYMYSDAFSNLTEIIVNEMKGVVVIVALVVVAVLIFTSSTYAEVLVLLGTFLAAAIINMGTNFLMGKISFVSNSVAIVLQLALSVDYAIIYCNRYKEEHKMKPIREAAIDALTMSIPEISASSLTTIAGLTAMTFMKFRLGFDMGVTLIKSIVCSLLSVFLLMPALLMCCGKLMDKTRHKNFVPKINFAGKFAYATRFIIPPLFVLLVVGAYFTFGNCNYAYSMDLVHTKRQNEQDIAANAIHERFGENNLVVVIVPSGSYEKEAELISELEACPEVNYALGIANIDAIGGYKLGDMVDYAEFSDIAGVDTITSQALFAYYAASQDEYRDASDDLTGYKVPLVDLFLFLYDMRYDSPMPLGEEQIALIEDLYSQLQVATVQLQSPDYSRFLLYVDLPMQGDDTFDFLQRARLIASQYYPDGGVYFTGNAVAASDFNDTFVSDNMVVSLMSLGLVMLILLFTFRSLGMPLLLILIIQGSIWINFSIPVLRGNYVFFMCYLIVSAIQMGANIDYAIVISSRYNELRGKMPKRDAIIDTLNLSFPTVITSGTMMVIAGLVIGDRVSQVVIAGIGQYVGIGTIITILLVNFVLPQLLLLGDGFVQATTVKLRGLHVKDPRRTARLAFNALLAAACVFALVAAPMCRAAVDSWQSSSVSENKQLLKQTRELRQLAEKLSMEQTRYDDLRYSFAESLVTDTVGGDQLASGEAQYNAGKAQLEAGQAQYDAGKAQLDDAKSKYESGKAEYEAGLAEYNAGKAQLEAGQARYDAGAAQLEAAKQQYAEGEAKLNAITPIYNAILPLYNDYQRLQAEYDAAVAEGDTVKALLIKPRLDAARIALDTQVAGTGYSLSEIITEYQAGQQQLAEGKAQIEAAEAELAAGKAELDAGYARLAEAEKQLAAGKAALEDGEKQIADGEQQLAAGKAELDAGYSRLDAAGAQLAAGRNQLAAAREQLQEDLAALDKYSDEKERLEAGMKLLMSDENVKKLSGSTATYAELCDAAEEYFASQIDSANDEAWWANVLTAALTVTVILALISLLLWQFARSSGAAAIIAGISAVAALVCGVLWHSHCPADGTLAFAAGLTLCLIAVVCTDLMAHRAKEASAVPASSATAN